MTGDGVSARELDRLHSKLDNLNDKIEDVPAKCEGRMDEKVRLHKAECEATDLVNVGQLSFKDRIKEQPEIPAIPTIISGIVIILAKLGWI